MMTRVPVSSTAARALAALIAFVAFGAITLRIGLYLGEGEQIFSVIWWLARFFTILTNVLVGGTFAMIAVGRGYSPRWLLVMTAAIAGVGIVYHVALARFLEHEGWEIVADQGVHTAAPILTVLWFLAFAKKAVMQMRDVPLVIAWPMLYCVYALVRGSFEGDYAYFFIDANTLSIGEMVINIAGLTLFFGLLGALLVLGLRMRGGKSAAD